MSLVLHRRMACKNRIPLVTRLIMNARISRLISFNATLATTFLATLGMSTLAQGADDPSKLAYSPHAGSNYPTKVLFGDTHLHTALSMDGGLSGATLMPADGFDKLKTRALKNAILGFTPPPYSIQRTHSS
jgi:hypothetical protein